MPPSSLAVVSVLLLAAAWPASAYAEAKIITLHDADARYTFRDVEEGYLRLDRQTGEVSLCAPDALGWSCRPLAENHRDYDQEISRLQSEITDLKEALREQTAKLSATAAAASPTPPAATAPAAPPLAPPPAAAVPNPDGDRTAAIITPQPPPAVESAAVPKPSFAAVAEAWQRLVDMVVSLQRQWQK